jgi:hypothetical protein
MNYYKKYIKYKNKYSLLKNNQIGGIESEYDLANFKPVCFSKGFRQHRTECWNDSIQHFFCFQDGIKEIVQKKLLFLSIDKIISLAELRGRKKYLPKLLQENKDMYDQMIIQLKKYLGLFQERFKLYYEYEFDEGTHGIVISKHKRDTTAITRENSGRFAIQGAIEGLKCTPNNSYTITEARTGAKGSYHSINLCILLSFVLLDTGTLIFNRKNINNFNEADIFDVKAILLENDEPMIQHVTLFYKCGDDKFYYDNEHNTNLALFDYNNYLTKKLEYNKKKDTDFGLYIRKTEYFITKIKDKGYLLDPKSNETLNEKITDEVFSSFTKIVKLIFIKFSNMTKENNRNYLQYELQYVDDRLFINNLKYYLDNDLNPNEIFIFGDSDTYLLGIFIIKQNYEIIELLLKKGADPNILDYKAELSQMYIILHDIQILELLLNYNVDINKLKDISNNTILHMACNLNYKEVVCLIIKNKNFNEVFKNLVNDENKTALNIATEKNFNAIVTLLT